MNLHHKVVRACVKARRLASIILLLILCMALACNRPKAPTEVTFWIGGDLDLGGNDSGVLKVLDEGITRNAIGIVTLAGPVTDTSTSRPGPRYSARRGLAQLLANGIRFVSIETDHRRDLGPEGEKKTIYALRDAGIDPFGGAVGIFKRRVLDFTIALVAVSTDKATISTADAVFKNARSASDYLFVFIRTKDETAARPLVESAVRSGAAVVVVGGGSDVGRAEKIADTLVDWGLGTLATANPMQAGASGMVLRFTLSKKRLSDARLYPIEPGVGVKPAQLSAHPAEALLKQRQANPKLMIFSDHAEL
jgi:hypothetical protein